jgi:hypothetical protein
VSKAAFAVLVAAFAVMSCGSETTGPSPVAGTWQFDASYSGNGYSCTIVAATLTLGRIGPTWIGTLAGGEARCLPPPGSEPPLPPAPLAATLGSITVRGDSVAFVLAGQAFAARGLVTSDEMAGTVQVATPFCQCSEQFLRGTWTAIRP